MSKYEVLVQKIEKELNEAKEKYKASGDQYDLGVLMTYGSVLETIKNLKGEEA